MPPADDTSAPPAASTPQPAPQPQDLESLLDQVSPDGDLAEMSEDQLQALSDALSADQDKFRAPDSDTWSQDFEDGEDQIDSEEKLLALLRGEQAAEGEEDADAEATPEEGATEASSEDGEAQAEEPPAPGPQDAAILQLLQAQQQQNQLLQAQLVQLQAQQQQAAQLQHQAQAQAQQRPDVEVMREMQLNPEDPRDVFMFQTAKSNQQLQAQHSQLEQQVAYWYQQAQLLQQQTTAQTQVRSQVQEQAQRHGVELPTEMAQALDAQAAQWIAAGYQPEQAAQAVLAPVLTVLPMLAQAKREPEAPKAPTRAKQITPQQKRQMQAAATRGKGAKKRAPVDVDKLLDSLPMPWVG